MHVDDTDAPFSGTQPAIFNNANHRTVFDSHNGSNTNYKRDLVLVELFLEIEFGQRN